MYRCRESGAGAVTDLLGTTFATEMRIVFAILRTGNGLSLLGNNKSEASLSGFREVSASSWVQVVQSLVWKTAPRGLGIKVDAEAATTGRCVGERGSCLEIRKKTTSCGQRRGESGPEREAFSLTTSAAVNGQGRCDGALPGGALPCPSHIREARLSTATGFPSVTAVRDSVIDFAIVLSPI